MGTVQKEPRFGSNRMEQSEQKTAESPVYPRYEEIMSPFTLEICVKNQVMFLDPAPESVRCEWYAQLRSWICKAYLMNDII